MATVDVSKPESIVAPEIDVEMEPSTVTVDSKDANKDANADGGEGSTETVEEAQAKALKQVEFYFADSNLPYDRFMWTLHSSNAEHWVPIATVASFKRMRQFQANGVPWVADALRKSESLLEVDETGTKVRRREEPQEPKGQFDRSVYAKGFGDETPTLQDELEQFFTQYGKVNAVRMRRIDGNKKFKGSVFCEFSSFDSVAKFLEADPKPQWKEAELLIMSKDAYCEMKIKEKGLSGKAAQFHKSGGNPTRKGFNAFNMKDQPSDKKKGKKPETEEKIEIFLEFMGKRLKVNQEDGGSVVDADVPFTKGATLRFNGCGSDVRFAEIKTALKSRFEKPPYIKYARGEDSGLVGFDKTLSDEDITFVRETLKTIGGTSVTWDLPDEETEKAFQVERAQTAAQRVVSTGAGQGTNSRGRGGRGSRGGRGGRGRGGRGAGRSGDADSETQKTEKRKRAVEPDGGPDTKGQGVPLIQPSKKPKIEGEKPEGGGEGS